MNNPKHSIIVPVYNTGSAIRKCIDSVLSQTYTDFELIVVDDGSKDDTPFIIDEYAGKDRRIKVTHIPNGGVSNARNVGIDMATGEYVMFIDSDDWIECDYLEQVERKLKDDSDIYIVGISQDFLFLDGNLSHSVVRVSPVGRIIEPDDLAKEFGYLNLTVNLASACLKTYRRSFIQQYNIRFEKQMVVLEDYYFVLLCMINKPKITCIPYIGYHYELPVQLDVVGRRGNRDLYPSVALLLDVLEKFNDSLQLTGHSYVVLLRNAQNIMTYVFRQSRTAKITDKSSCFSRMAENPFFIRHGAEMAAIGGGRFRLLRFLMRLHLYYFSYLAYRYL